MNILSLKIKNFLSISEVEIKPGQINQIVGGNNQGKTTILKALDFLFKGSTNGNLVKFGQDSAEVIVELEDKTMIKRKINSAGRQTVDMRKGDFKTTAPQTHIDALADVTAFNPLDVLDPKNRADAIMKSIDMKLTPELLAASLGCDVPDLPPVDYSLHGIKVLDQAWKYYYQRRAEANKDALEKKKRFETYSADLKDVPAPKETREQVQQAIDELNKKLNDINGELALAVPARLEVEKVSKKIKIEIDDVNSLQAEVDELQAEMDRIDGQIIDKRKRIVDLEKEFKERAASVPNTVSLEKVKNEILTERESKRSVFKEIEAYEAVQKQKQMIGDMEITYLEAEHFSKKLTEKVDALAGPIKTSLMDKVEMPIKGLEYKNGEFFVSGTSIDNLSSSQSLKLAIGVARKLAKETKLICVDGAELLDEEMFKTLHDEIKSDGFTYFLTKVGEPFKADGDKVFKVNKGQLQEAT